MIEIYPDGCCIGNPGPGGWAAVWKDEHSEIHSITGSDPGTTNQRMELTAALKALEHFPAGSKLTIITDSQYVQKGMDEWITGWKLKKWRNSANKPVANVDLWKQLDSLRWRRKVGWEWVRGHSGDPMNELAHKLAHKEAKAIARDARW